MHKIISNEFSWFSNITATYSSARIEIVAKNKTNKTPKYVLGLNYNIMKKSEVGKPCKPFIHFN